MSVDPRLLDRERTPLNKGETQLSTFSGSSLDPAGAAALKFPPDFQDETPYFRAAVAKFLKENRLDDVPFEELTPTQQSDIIRSAQNFKTLSHEGAVE